MITITLRQSGTTSTEAHYGPLGAARARAREWCSGWNVRTAVSVEDEDGLQGAYLNTGDGEAEETY